MELSDLKKCSKCGEEKDLSHFVRDKKNYDGFRSSCKECRKKHLESIKIKDKPKIEALTCRICKEIKTISNFKKCATNISGYNNRCKECLSKQREKSKYSNKISIEEKTCSTCKQKKDISRFYKNISSKDGRDHICILCKQKYVERLKEKRINNEFVPNSHKKCNKCGEIHSIENFSKNNKTKDGLEYSCKNCKKEYHFANRSKRIQAKREWDKRNPDKIRAQGLKKYGLTIPDYDEMFKKQNGKCLICGVDQSELKKSLFVDHCHNTNKIRGLLCNLCNRGIGSFRDNINLLEQAIKYLKRSQNE